MADGNKLAEVVAMLCERDDDFKPFENVAVHTDQQTLWALSNLKLLLGYREDESIDNALNRAKIAASKFFDAVEKRWFGPEVPSRRLMTRWILHGFPIMLAEDFERLRDDFFRARGRSRGRREQSSQRDLRRRHRAARGGRERHPRSMKAPATSASPANRSS